MSNFNFLDTNLFADVKQNAIKAEAYAIADPLAAGIYLRRALESAVKWMYLNDDELTHLGELRQTYNRFLNTDELLNRDEFRELFNREMHSALFQIKRIGNKAAHSGGEDVTRQQVETGLLLFFDFCKWLAASYQDGEVNIHQKFDRSLLKDKETSLSGKEVNKLREQIEDLNKQLEEKLQVEPTPKVQEQRQEFKEQRQKANIKYPLKATDWLEKETRHQFIDYLISEAGWDISEKDVKEFQVKNLPETVFPSGKGNADYVLWGDDGLPLAVIEAKRTISNAEKGRHQAKLYADGLQKMYGQRPVIYYTNGFSTWIWDDEFYPPREVMGFHSQEELQTMVSRRGMRRFPWEEEVDQVIAGRDYQLEAISSIEKRYCDSKELKGAHRRALIVMATGAGKTRTSSALVDVLMRSQWVKRVLFLADRNALVRQAKNDYYKYLPHLSAIDLTKEKEDKSTRLVFSTYKTILNRIDIENKMYSIGHFDLIIIDEAHRSIYSKYRAIFDYFDSLVLGLTATPKDQVDRDTFEFFDCPPGDPTYKYDLNEAVDDEYLVPPKAKQIDLGFIRKGIKYDDLSDEEKRVYEETFESEFGYVPKEIPASALNEWLYNEDTISKVLAYLMENGIKVKDKIGKTIIFARSIPHAIKIKEIFDKQYPQYSGKLCQPIYNSEQSEDLIDSFKIQDSEFKIAVSVDMLDTGIDVPEIVNLVLFKPVFSKSKFWQMVGRGTRLRPDLFAPSQDKEHFMIFDFCRNIEFFRINEGINPPIPESVSTRIFNLWISIADQLKDEDYLKNEEYQSYKSILLGKAHWEILRLLDRQHSVNIRNRLQYLLNYQNRNSWEMLSPADISDINEHLAPLVELEDEDYDAKLFDNMIHKYQLELLQENPNVDNHQARLYRIAKALKKIGNVSAVRAHQKLIDKLLDMNYILQLNIIDLEKIRIDLRHLMRLIEGSKKKIYNTNFTDIIEADEDVDMGLSTGQYSNYKRRLNQLLEKHKDHLIIHKIHTNEPITTAELKKLEELLLADMEEDSRERFKERMKNKEPLGVLIRNFIGMKESAARKAFVDFSRNGSLTEPQKRFISQIIQHLTNKGIVDPAMLYESPYKEINDQGLDGLFDDKDATKIVSILEEIRSNVVG